MDKQIREFSKKNNRKRILKRVVSLLCVVVLLFTVNTLKRSANTLERIPMCGLIEHIHGSECYNGAGELACGMAEHVHTDACYQQSPTGGGTMDNLDINIDGYDSRGDQSDADGAQSLDLSLDLSQGDLLDFVQDPKNNQAPANNDLKVGDMGLIEDPAPVVANNASSDGQEVVVEFEDGIQSNAQQNADTIGQENEKPVETEQEQPADIEDIKEETENTAETEKAPAKSAETEEAIEAPAKTEMEEAQEQPAETETEEAQEQPAETETEEEETEAPATTEEDQEQADETEEAAVEPAETETEETQEQSAETETEEAQEQPAETETEEAQEQPAETETEAPATTEEDQEQADETEEAAVEPAETETEETQEQPTETEVEDGQVKPVETEEGETEAPAEAETEIEQVKPVETEEGETEAPAEAETEIEQVKPVETEEGETEAPAATEEEQEQADETEEEAVEPAEAETKIEEGQEQPAETETEGEDEQSAETEEGKTEAPAATEEEQEQADETKEEAVETAEAETETKEEAVEPAETETETEEGQEQPAETATEDEQEQSTDDEDEGEQSAETEEGEPEETAAEEEQEQDDAETQAAERRYTATVDFAEVESYPISLRGVIANATPAEDYEDAPEATEEKPLDEWSIELDSGLFETETTEDDVLLTPVADFESTEIFISNGSRYELTLVNCTLEQPEEAPQTEPEAQVARPAQHFEESTTYMNVVVDAPEGAFPEGTVMVVKDVEDESTIQNIEQSVTKDFVEVTGVHAVDISFWYNDTEIEPLLPIAVVMSAVEADAKSEAPVVVHVTDDGETSVVDSESISASEASLEMPATADPTAQAFEAESFSVYALVTTQAITTKYIDDSGETWSIKVGYKKEAKLPEGASLKVSEVKDESYLAEAETALEDGKRITKARFFDIKIVDANGNEVQPEDDVDVIITLDGDEGVVEAIPEQADPEQTEEPTIVGESAVYAMHFVEENNEIVDVKTHEATETDDGVTFAADGFSVWGVVYTVDFTYVDEQGVEHFWQFPGRGSWLLRNVLHELGIEGEEITAADVELVEAVEETSDRALYITRDSQTDDWWINSDVAFDDTYLLTVTLDGVVYEIKVTDANDVESFDVRLACYNYDGTTPAEIPSVDGDSYYLIAMVGGMPADSASFGEDTPLWSITQLQTGFNVGKTDYIVNILGFSSDPQNAYQNGAEGCKTYSELTEEEKEAVEVRFVHIKSDYYIGSYRNLKDLSQWNGAVYDEMRNGGFNGYDFVNTSGAVTGKDWDYEVNMQKGNTNEFDVKLVFDQPGVISGDYYVRLDATSQDGYSHYYKTVKITSDGTSNVVYLPVEGNWSGGQKYSKNWQNITAKIIKPNGDYDLTDENNYKDEQQKKYVMSYVLDGYTYVDVSKGKAGIVTESDNDAHVNHIEYIFNMNKLRGDAALTPADILGDAVEFGVVADTYKQGGHTETNFAVNTYDSSGTNIDMDGAGDTAIPFYAGNITNQLWISSGTKGMVDIYIPEDQDDTDQPGELAGENRKIRLSTTKGYYIVHMPRQEIKSYVDSMIEAGQAMSASLAEKSIMRPQRMANSNSLDFTDYPDGITIYVDCTDIKDMFTAGGWTIHKKENQSIVFNIPGESVNIQEFYVYTYDADGVSKAERLGSTTTPLNGNDALNRQVDDVILNHITFNCFEAKTVNFDNASALFLAPFADKVTQTNGAGWILTKGTFETDKEWHFYYHYRHYVSVSEGNIIRLNKQLKDKDGNEIPYLNMDFKFKFTETDSDWQPLTSGGTNKTATTTDAGWFQFTGFKYNNFDISPDGNSGGKSKSFYYVIEEVPAEGAQVKDGTTYYIDGVEYNKNKVKIRVDAADDGKGHINCKYYAIDDQGVEREIQPDLNVFSFGNFENKIAVGKATVGGKKIITCEDESVYEMTQEDVNAYTFTLKAVTPNAPMPTVVSQKMTSVEDTTFSFGDIDFSSANLDRDSNGRPQTTTFEYRIVESGTRSGEDFSIINDEHEHTVRITVSVDPNDYLKLNAEVKYYIDGEEVTGDDWVFNNTYKPKDDYVSVKVKKAWTEGSEKQPVSLYLLRFTKDDETEPVTEEPSPSQGGGTSPAQETQSTGSIRITQNLTGAGASSSTFTGSYVVKKDGNTVRSGSYSNKNGATITDLEPGSYTVEVNGADTNYNVTTAMQTTSVTVTAGNTVDAGVSHELTTKGSSQGESSDTITINVHLDPSNAMFEWYQIQLQAAYTTGWAIQNQKFSPDALTKDTNNTSTLTVPRTDGNGNAYEWNFTIGASSFGKVAATSQSTGFTYKPSGDGGNVVLSGASGTVDIYLSRNTASASAASPYQLAFNPFVAYAEGDADPMDIDLTDSTLRGNIGALLDDMAEGFTLDTSFGKAITLSNDPWEQTVSRLPMYDSDGKEYYYFMVEGALTGYDVVYDHATPVASTVIKESSGRMVTLKATNTEKYTEATVKKVWDDANNQDGKRPESLTVTLSNGMDVTLNEGNNWSATVKNLPKYDNGIEINYTWTEKNLPADYTLTDTSKNGTITTLTNSYTPETTEATVKKVWNDANNQDGIRPESLTVTLSNGTEVTLNEGNNWEATVNNLPKYSGGTLIEYTWTEGSLPEGYTLTNTSVNGTITTLTNSYTPEVTEATVKKIWDDANNQDGKRPESLTVTLSNGTEVTLNAANNWEAKVEHLPKYANGEEIVYTWTEGQMPEGYTLTNTSKNGTVTTLTNSYSPEKTEATVKKIWDDNNNQDGIRPDSLTVTLSNGTTVTLNEANGWTAKVENLPKYANGEEIEYSWTEGTLPEGYTLSGTSKEGTVTTLTNSHTPETISIPVVKNWTKASGLSTPNDLVVDVKLYKVVEGQEVEVTQDAEGNALTALTLKQDGSWTGNFEKLPKYSGGQAITYRVKEVAVRSEDAGLNATTETDIKKYFGNDGKVSAYIVSTNPSLSATLNNTVSDKDFHFTKEWWVNGRPQKEEGWPVNVTIPSFTLERYLEYTDESGNNHTSANKDPDFSAVFANIGENFTTIQPSNNSHVDGTSILLKRDGEGNGFKYTVTGLPKYGSMYDNRQKRYGEWKYRVSEAKVNGYNEPIYLNSEGNPKQGTSYAEDGETIKNVLITVALPATGGMGTGVVYGAGAALILLAVLGLVLMNRKRSRGTGI